MKQNLTRPSQPDTAENKIKTTWNDLEHENTNHKKKNNQTTSNDLRLLETTFNSLTQLSKKKLKT